jgi:hypothetical protein
MGNQPHRTRSSLAPTFLLGVATGLLLGLLASLSPFIAIVAIVAVLVATVLSVGQRADPSRTMQLAGTLVGAGAWLFYGAINTVAACINTDDFCGNANVLPLGVFAVVTIGAGAIATAVAAFRRPG